MVLIRGAASDKSRARAHRCAHDPALALALISFFDFHPLALLARIYHKVNKVSHRNISIQSLIYRYIGLNGIS